MINAIYKFEDSTNVFYIQFSNTLTIWPDYKEVNATYHLENAIKKANAITADKKALDAKTPELTFQIKVSDPKNDYLKAIAITFVQFIKGMGVTRINTEGF